MIIKPKLYVWGIGDESKKLFEKFPMYLEFVEKFIDSNKTYHGEQYYGKMIISPDEVPDTEDTYIIIATKKYYDDIANQLEKRKYKNYFGISNILSNWVEPHFSEILGKCGEIAIKTIQESKVISLLELKQIASHTQMPIGQIMECVRRKHRDKRIVSFYGNCQTLSYISAVRNNMEICSKYIFLQIPPIQDLERYQLIKEISCELFAQIDIFIYQNVSPGNKICYEVSSEYIMQFLRDETIKICIPNIYFTGYFPQIVGSKPILLDSKYKYVGDINILNMMGEKTTKQIAELLDNNEFYSEEECIDNVRQSLNELKEREKLCDIIISDFIEKNYKTRKLFYTHNHPTGFVICEMLERIFCKLDTRMYRFDKCEGVENDTHQFFIYPSVKKGLKLEFDKECNSYVYCNLIKKTPSTMEEYVEDFVKYSSN